MRAKLLGTSALTGGLLLLAGPAVAEEWEVRVGGYYNAMIAYANTSTPVGDISDADITKDTEIIFQPGITLDNGLTFGVNIHLEGESGTDIDESFAYVRGSFGEILIGAADGAARRSHYGIPSVGVGIDDYYLEGVGPGEAIIDSNRDLFNTGNYNARDDDSVKITYFTPRFAGFQLGVSYIPEASPDKDTFPSEASNNFIRPENIFDVGLRYAGEFGGYRVAGSIGGQLVGDANNTSEQGAWMTAAGVRVSKDGVSVGVSGSHEVNPSFGVDERNVFGVGATYETGQLAFSLAGAYGSTDTGSSATDDEQLTFEAGVRYNLGPGVKAAFSLYFLERDFSFGETDSITGIGMIGLSF